MANNIGVTSTTLSRTIGNSTTINNASSITAISGYVDVGFIVFDNDGTLGICTSFTRDQQDNPTYVFRTCSLDTEIDIQNILSQSY
jgi:hypothetical protein